jgi:hypothetical protein
MIQSEPVRKGNGIERSSTRNAVPEAKLRKGEINEIYL